MTSTSYEINYIFFSSFLLYVYLLLDGWLLLLYTQFFAKLQQREITVKRRTQQEDDITRFVPQNYGMIWKGMSRQVLAFVMLAFSTQYKWHFFRESADTEPKCTTIEP